MLNPTDQQRIDEARSEFKAAQTQLHDTNVESRKAYSDFYDKILAYSAAAFSFSVALIGLALDNGKKEFLSQVIYHLPLIKWLYVSMVFYLLSCFAVLFSKIMNATYVSAFGKRHYHQDGMALLELEVMEIEEMLPLAIYDEEKVRKPEHLFPYGEELSLKRSNLDAVKRVLSKNIFEENVTVWAMKISRWLSLSFVFVATVLLLLFTVQLAQMIVWG